MKKLTQEEAVKKARDIHGDKYEYGEYIDAKAPWDIKCPIHGRFKQPYDRHVNQKCDCDLCGNEKIAASKLLDTPIYIEKLLRTNKHAKNWDLSWVNYTGVNNEIHFKCNKCGQDIYMTPHSLANGSDCSKCDIIDRANKQRFDTTTYIKLLFERNPDAITWDLSEVDYTGNHNKVWITCLICGCRWSADAASLYNHGCPGCNKSKGETKIIRWLKNNGFIEEDDFTVQKWFDDCRNPVTGRVLKFDVYFPKLDLIIEYDGIQHFKELAWFGGLPALFDLQTKDGIKNRYCMGQNGRPRLLRISYLDFNNIETILQETLINNNRVV